MIVFKKYFKIIKQHIGLIIMFSAISIGISIANTSYSSSNDYNDTKSTIAIINNDESKIVDNLITYLSSKSNIKEVNNNSKDIQDALYDNKVDAILIIPSNFTTELLNNNNPNIEIKKSAQEYSTTIEIITNQYIKMANAYSKLGISEKEIINNINRDLSSEIKVNMSSENKSSLEKLAVYYSFENYAFLSIFIFIIGYIMCIFNKDTINKRNNISKMKPKEFSRQLFLGHISLTMIIWLVFVVMSIVVYQDAIFNINGLLFIANSLLFAITCTSLAFLIGNLIKNENVISGIQNVFSLGLSFISGCFVPIEVLAPGIVNFSKLFPSYWFIQNNYAIADISNFTLETLKPLIQNSLIVLAFGIIYLIISRIIIKRKAKR